MPHHTDETPAPVPLAECQPALIAIRVGNIIYTGEYDPNHCGGYKPGELTKGQPIEIRLEQEKMYIEFPDGRELETKIVNKVEQ